MTPEEREQAMERMKARGFELPPDPSRQVAAGNQRRAAGANTIARRHVSAAAAPPATARFRR